MDKTSKRKWFNQISASDGCCFSMYSQSGLYIPAPQVLVRYLNRTIQPKTKLAILLALVLPVFGYACIAGFFYTFYKLDPPPPSIHPDCVAWRGTWGCSPYGHVEREIPCWETINGSAGYCECSGGVTVSRMNCSNHKFTCNDECVKHMRNPKMALPLPKTMQCSPGDEQLWQTFKTSFPSGPFKSELFLTGVSSYLFPPEDASNGSISELGERLEAASSKLWAQVLELMKKHNVTDAQLPGSRTEDDDWVREGMHMERKHVAKLKNGMNEYRSSLPSYPGSSVFEGRGVVIVGGGMKYIVPAWVNVYLLRLSGCSLPIEMWFPVKELPTPELEAALASLGVTCRVFREAGMDQKGYSLKVTALLLSQFKEVLFLDADNLAMRDPTYIFESKPWKEKGALLFNDLWDAAPGPELHEILNIDKDKMPSGSFESGQIVMDKERHWRGLLIAMYMNKCPFYPELLSNVHGKGDKETFAYGILAAGDTYYNMPALAEAGNIWRICPEAEDRAEWKCRNMFLGNTMVQHDPDGRILFFHSNLDKLTLRLPNDFKDYSRRWSILYPTQQSLLEWESHGLIGSSVDPEHRIFNLTRALRCAPFFSAYNMSRVAFKDKGVLPVLLPVDRSGANNLNKRVKYPDMLEGFHEKPQGLNFPDSWVRGGWPGLYTSFFNASATDRWWFFYFSTIRPRFIRRIERWIRGHGGDHDGSGDGSTPFGPFKKH